MKKLILSTIAAIAVALPSVAQDSGEHLDVWKNNKGITLSYITNQNLEDVDAEIPFEYDSKVGFSFSTGNTYLWPRSAGWCGNRLKIGVDARWFDFSYVKYDNYPKINGEQMDDWGNPDYSDEGDEITLDPFQIHLGIGVGPAVAFVPFADKNNAVRFLRLNLFAHFTPQASALFCKNEKGDTEASWAFVPAYDFGMNVQWKFLTLGFEARWGKAKYNTILGDDEESWEYDETTGGVSYNNETKRTFKNSSFRVSLGFRF